MLEPTTKPIAKRSPYHLGGNPEIIFSSVTGWPGGIYDFSYVFFDDTSASKATKGKTEEEKKTRRKK